VTATLLAGTCLSSVAVAQTVVPPNTTLLFPCCEQFNVVNNGIVVFDLGGGTGGYGGVISGAGSVIVTGGSYSYLGMSGTNTYSGTTTVANHAQLAVTGSIANSTIILIDGGKLSGNGAVGHVTNIDGLIAPGNSIGTLSISGNLVKHRGHYHAELNAAGQSDRINVSGTATINGGTVVVLPDPGIYPNSTTYTIVSAAGGVSGGYTRIVSDLAFLTPTLSYDPNNVYLTLALQGAAFSGYSGNTPNQRAVGYALDQSYASASGDYATVIGALAGLSTAQASPALSAISSQPWANFGTTNLAGSALFMNTLGQQMAMARGGQSSGGQRQALAQACDDAACDAASPFSVWGSAVGGVGSVQGNGNASTLTYNLGGGAAGVDYRATPNVVLGLGTSFASGTQWTNGFMGKAWSNAVSVAAYGSFTQWGLYADLLAGYAYANNQAQRQIMVPNLQPRTASGSTGANQFLGQAELGYQVAVYAPASATVTPFARLQVMSVNQAAFSEWGANSLSLNVAQQTTNSLRSTLGMDLGGAIGLADGRSFDMALRLGWLHEYADVARPITGAFAGAPGASFIVYGATPQRDAAVIGFQVGTSVADNAQIYLRYDGDIGSGTDNHALSAGLRLRF
jgi:outer membrane autotransporter protein